MNDELNPYNSEDTQDSKKSLYQGNYDNDYRNSINHTADSSGDLSNRILLSETPKYMNLGAPRERDEDDVAHHEKSMRTLSGEDEKINSAFSSLGFTPRKKATLLVAPKQKSSITIFLARYLNLYFHGPHFRMSKTSGLETHTISSKIKWGVLIVFLAISVSSFLTQSVLYIKDYVTGGDKVAVLNTVQSTTSPNTSQTPFSGEQKGSDDGNLVNSSSSVGQKIGKAPQYRLNDANRFPALSAKSFLVADLVTGEYIKESQDVGNYPLASVSKLMTALVTHEKMDQKSMATVSRSSYNTYGTQGELLLGESIRVSDLMYPLLMESSNDGAEVLADAYGRDKFMVEMNKKAMSLGMNDTYYNDPSGLDPKNVSTVEDQFKLAKYIYESAPVIFDLTRVRQFEILNHRWYNKNKTLNMPAFIGGKNGFIDESRQTTVSLFDIQMAKGGKRKIAIVLLRTNDREGDVVKVLNFLKKNAYYELSSTSTEPE
jgi:D-alanyl-D-alanine carboxypeptidase